MRLSRLLYFLLLSMVLIPGVLLSQEAVENGEADNKAIVYDIFSRTASVLSIDPDLDFVPALPPGIGEEAASGESGSPGLNFTNDQPIDATLPANRFICRTVTYWPNGGESSGSAILIDNDHALTAAHVFYNTEKGGWATQVEIRPGQKSSGGAPYGNTQVQGYMLWSNYIDNESQQHDIGVMHMIDPLGDEAGWAGFATNSSANFFLNNTFYQKGYKGTWQMYSRSGNFDAVESEWVATYRNSSIVGQSGSGITRLVGTNWVAYGVAAWNRNTNGYDETGVCRITPLKFNGISNYIDAHGVAAINLQNQTVSNTRTWSTSGLLRAKNNFVVTGSGNVTFVADFVDLDDGFRANTGSEFRAGDAATLAMSMNRLIPEEDLARTEDRSVPSLSETPEAKSGPENPAIPQSFYLNQNYPNPFNPLTTIAYGLPEPAQVELTIYNSLGQYVRTLSRGFQQPGNRRLIWDGTNDTGETVSSGVYVYRLRAGEQVLSRKMLLMQ